MTDEVRQPTRPPEEGRAAGTPESRWAEHARGGGEMGTPAVRRGRGGRGDWRARWSTDARGRGSGLRVVSGAVAESAVWHAAGRSEDAGLQSARMPCKCCEL